MQVLTNRLRDVACVNETRWKCKRCRFCGIKRQKVFWTGGKQKIDVHFLQRNGCAVHIAMAEQSFLGYSPEGKVR